MASHPRKRTLKWLLPLWIAAALLLTAGWYASAQDTTAAAPPQAVDTAAPGSPNAAPLPSSEPAQRAQTPESGLVADSQSVAAQAPAAAQPTVGEMARQSSEEASGTPVQKAISFLGLLVFIGIAWLLSVNRRGVNWMPVVIGIALQFVFAFFIIIVPIGRGFFEKANDVFNALIGYTIEGARFLFGNLVFNNVPVGPGGAGFPPMAPVGDTAAWANTGAFFAFNVLPTIIFFSSLMTLLYHVGIMGWVVKGFGWVMMRTMKISGAESLSTAGNIFLGQTEAPILVKPFIGTMTRSELHCIMVGGFGTVAGGVLAAYVGFLGSTFPDIAGHLIAASVMAAPACIAISKIMYPETEEPVTAGTVKIKLEKVDANAIDAAARGASEGLALALNVGAMLLAFIALVALLNGILGGVSGWFGLELTIQKLLGWVGAPLAWLMGTPWKDAMEVGTLLGEKTALNEFVAYAHLGQMMQTGAGLEPRSVVIATYALCGFANFSSIAIQIGGIGAMAPERRGDLSRLGLRAMIAGTLANFMTACVVGMII
jgi:concentrative nucleoside transporter, CNT family